MLLSGQDVMVLFGELQGLQNSGNFIEAVKVLDQIEDLTLKSEQIDLYIYALCFRAYCQFELEDYKLMNSFALKANSVFENWSKKDSTILPTLYYILGKSYDVLGNSINAHNYYLSSYQQTKKHNTLAFREEDLLNNLALCLMNISDFEKARLYLKTALESKSANFFERDRVHLNTLIARTYQEENQLEKAEEYYSIAMSKRDLIKISKRKIIVLNEYAGFLILSGKIEEAKKVILEIEELGVSKENENNYKQNVAKLALYHNNEEEALGIFNEVIANVIEDYGLHNKDVIETYNEIAETYLKVGDYSLAEKYVDLSLNANLVNNNQDDQMGSRAYLIPNLALNALLKKAKSESQTNYPNAKKNYLCTL